MSNPNTSPEIVTERELEPTLKKLDVDTFLRLYNEWKVTKDPSTFAALRSMHENAGYNNKQLFTKVEQEMHEIAAIVQKYKDGKLAVAQGTADAISTAPRSYNATVKTLLQTYDGEGKPIDKDVIAPGLSITLTIPSVDKVIEIGGGKLVLTEVAVDGKRKVWVQKSDIAQYISPSGVVTSPQGAVAPSVPKERGVEDIKEALAEINPENLEKAVTLSEEIIKIAPEGTRATLRGIHGAIIFQTLRDAGHNLTMKNGQVEIIPKPGVSVVNLQEKLQTLVNTKKITLETLQLGMLYSSGAFKEYSGLKKTRDATGKDIIDPKASVPDFLQYLQDSRKAGDQSPDIQSILQSSSFLRGVNMQQAIRGFQDMGQIGEWIQRNPAIMGSAVAGTVRPTVAQGAVATTPSNLLTGNLSNGLTGGKVTGVVGDSFRGLVGGISDIFGLANGDPLAQAGIGVGLIYGVYKLFQKFGFLGGIGSLLGIGALNSIDDIGKRLGIDTGNVKKKVTQAGEEAVGAVKRELGVGSGGDTPPAPPAQPAAAPRATLDRANLSESARAGIRSIEGNKSLIEDITNHPKSNAVQKATLDEYLSTLHKDSIQNMTLDKLIYTPKHDQSIFSEHAATLFGDNADITDSMSRKLLKRIIRSYIGSNEPLSGSTSSEPEGKGNLDAWKKKYPEDQWKTKTLKDLVAEIHKK